MQQIKLFKGIESERDQVEAQINAWLAKSGARVVHMSGGLTPQTVNADGAKGAGRQFLPSDLFLAIVYETG